MTAPRAVGDEEVAAAIGAGPWRREGDHLVFEHRFAGFGEAVAFVDAVAALAAAADHHPDIDVRFDRVRLEVWTHVTGGLTDRDLALAAQVAGLLS